MHDRKVVQFPSQKREMARYIHFGQQFPPLFRVTGFFWKDVDGIVEPDFSQPAVDYSLSEDVAFGFENAAFRPILHLDHQIDDDIWLMIRKHDHEEAAYAYAQAVRDLNASWCDSPSVFITEHGVFTLIRRERDYGRPSHLVIYVAPEKQFEDGSVGGPQVKVIGPHGDELPASLIE